MIPVCPEDSEDFLGLQSLHNFISCLLNVAKQVEQGQQVVNLDGLLRQAADDIQGLLPDPSRDLKLQLLGAKTAYVVQERSEVTDWIDRSREFTEQALAEYLRRNIPADHFRPALPENLRVIKRQYIVRETLCPPSE